uniref:Protein kinase domain-containing protein n=1 Tax=Knipowitschia caucasica TaxID=637954 RepID=A0AAV2J1M7_KNICA
MHWCYALVLRAGVMHRCSQEEPRTKHKGPEEEQMRMGAYHPASPRERQIMQSYLQNPPDLRPGSLLQSPDHCFQLQEHLASGVYGKVIDCWNLTAQRPAVLKVLQVQNAEFFWQEEAEILQILAQHQGHKNHVVQWFHSFQISGTFIHEFEKLDISLKQYVMESPYGGLGLMEIRPIVSQMAQALHFLKELGIMHNDIKLDNIMLVDHLRKPLCVKLIDFGLASTENIQGKEIHNRYFRAPEVFFGAPVDSAADMWALGIIAVTTFMGRMPLPGPSDEDMMRHIVETVGHCPESVLDSGLYTAEYYGLSSSRTWEYKFPPLDPQKRAIHRLDDIHKSGPPGRPFASVELQDRRAFVNLVKHMLDPDPATRITPAAVMSHRFVSMHHLAKGVPCYHSTSVHIMDKANGIVRNELPSNCLALFKPVQSVPVSAPVKRKRTQEDDCDVASPPKKRQIQETTATERGPDTIEANLPEPDPLKETRTSLQQDQTMTSPTSPNLRIGTCFRSPGPPKMELPSAPRPGDNTSCTREDFHQLTKSTQKKDS